MGVGVRVCACMCVCVLRVQLHRERREYHSPPDARKQRQNHEGCDNRRRKHTPATGKPSHSVSSSPRDDLTTSPDSQQGPLFSPISSARMQTSSWKRDMQRRKHTPATGNPSLSVSCPPREDPTIFSSSDSDVGGFGFPSAAPSPVDALLSAGSELDLGSSMMPSKDGEEAQSGRTVRI